MNESQRISTEQVVCRLPKTTDGEFVYPGMYVFFVDEGSYGLCPVNEATISSVSAGSWKAKSNAHPSEIKGRADSGIKWFADVQLAHKYRYNLLYSEAMKSKKIAER